MPNWKSSLLVEYKPHRPVGMTTQQEPPKMFQSVEDIGVVIQNVTFDGPETIMRLQTFYWSLAMFYFVKYNKHEQFHNAMYDLWTNVAIKEPVCWQESAYHVAKALYATNSSLTQYKHALEIIDKCVLNANRIFAKYSKVSGISSEADLTNYFAEQFYKERVNYLYDSLGTLYAQCTKDAAEIWRKFNIASEEYVRFQRMSQREKLQHYKDSLLELKNPLGKTPPY